MGFPKDKNFSRHSENLQEIRKSLTELERLHKRTIREGHDGPEHPIRRVHLLMLGVYAEAYLRKILADPTGFSPAERDEIWSKNSQNEQWKHAIKLAKIKHYGEHPPAEADSRLNRATQMVDAQLGTIMTDRNKLAHGQWLHQLKSGENDKFRQTPLPLDYNYTEIFERTKAIRFTADLIHKLCVSEPTFEREFQRLSDKIDECSWTIANPNEQQFKLAEQLRKRTIRVR